MKKLNLFQNAIDSLEVGIGFYTSEKFKTAHKHAIVNIFHSIELLLKERLAKESPILIYKDVHRKKISKTSKTVGFEEILILYSNLEIDLSDDELKTLKHLQSQRNDIIHFEYEPSKQDGDMLGMSLKFIKEFMEEQLDTKLENEINNNLYQQIEDIVESFEERYEKALQEANDIITPKTKDDLCDMREVIECPECGTDTLACVGNECFCTLCKEHFDVDTCNYCGSFSTSIDEEMAMCSSCMDHIWNKDE